MLGSVNDNCLTNIEGIAFEENDSSRNTVEKSVMLKTLLLHHRS